MIRISTIAVCIALLVVSCPAFAAPTVPAPPGKKRDAMNMDLLPIATKSYDSNEVLKLDLTEKVDDIAVVGDLVSGHGGRAFLKRGGSSSSNHGPWPIVLSIIAPGAGEIYMGYYKRGIALLAMEAAAWIGYAHNRSKGLDTRRRYESFADAHWSVSKWLLEHPSGPYGSVEAIEAAGQDGSWEGRMTYNYSDNFFYMPFIPKEQDKQEYYENLGKYNWFLSGWDDWSSAPDPSGSYYEFTNNRSFYMGLRANSNHQLTVADRFIYLSIAARAYSLVETIILSRRSGDEDVSRLGFDVETQGFSSTRFVLEYRFK
jgi:hypothetical protein